MEGGEFPNSNFPVLLLRPKSDRAYNNNNKLILSALYYGFLARGEGAVLERGKGEGLE